ncbi:hypothetical protein B0T11DRAFT_130865 [Plectosphaerella cucumerina]|uniref:Uncharacterized protein n=1 Tax=Plectosphaerella cucumerina TaxID=40658 RepID=A0A8K0T5U3_9PEZI|nr:hypothetical protein B0T11DRAFT_130865 [Plectosphaerella cucumerina]
MMSFVRRGAAWSTTSSSHLLHDSCSKSASTSLNHQKESGTNITMAFLPRLCLLLPSRCRKPKPPAHPTLDPHLHVHSVRIPILPASDFTSSTALSAAPTPFPPKRKQPRQGKRMGWSRRDSSTRSRGPGYEKDRGAVAHVPACPALLGPARRNVTMPASPGRESRRQTDGSGGRMALGEEEGKHPHRARAAQGQPARDGKLSYM